MTCAVDSDSEKTGHVENAGPRQFKEDKAVDEDSGGDAELAGATRGVRLK